MNIRELKRNLVEDRRIRLLFYPYRASKKWKTRKSYSESQYPLEMQKYHNIHCNEKCYVIGNGPSLTMNDLDLIKDEYSIGTNKIYNVFDKTIWRPTYYLCEDTLSIIEEIGADIEKLNDCKKIFLNWAVKDRIGEKENIIYCIFNPYYVINLWDYKGVKISEDCSREFGWASTVTFSAVQLAIYMGFREIYLLGVDFSYPFYRDEKGKKHNSGATSSHFDGGGYGWINYMNLTTNKRGYEKAKEYCDENDIILKNATRGGKLDVFERISLEETLGGTKL